MFTLIPALFPLPQSQNQSREEQTWFDGRKCLLFCPPFVPSRQDSEWCEDRAGRDIDTDRLARGLAAGERRRGKLFLLDRAYYLT